MTTGESLPTLAYSPEPLKNIRDVILCCCGQLSVSCYSILLDSEGPGVVAEAGMLSWLPRQPGGLPRRFLGRRGNFCFFLSRPTQSPTLE